MSEFETPIMRDISKLMLPVAIGILLAFGFLYLYANSGFLVASIEFEMEAYEMGFTWADKKLNGCFQREGGVTYFSEYDQKEVTSTLYCSSSALPWEVFVWQIPLIVGLLIASVIIRKKGEKLADMILDWKDRRQTKKLLKCQLEELHEQYINDELIKCPDCGKQLVKSVHE